MLRLREALKLDFDEDEFIKLPPHERAEICVALAERAQAIGIKARTVERQILLNIASQWLRLADLIRKGT